MNNTKISTIDCLNDWLPFFYKDFKYNVLNLFFKQNIFWKIYYLPFKYTYMCCHKYTVIFCSFSKTLHSNNVL